MKVNRYIDKQTKPEAKKEDSPKEKIELLLKEHADVEIEFFYNKKKIDSATTFL